MCVYIVAKREKFHGGTGSCDTRIVNKYGDNTRTNCILLPLLVSRVYGPSWRQYTDCYLGTEHWEVCSCQSVADCVSWHQLVYGLDVMLDCLRT